MCYLGQFCLALLFSRALQVWLGGPHGHGAGGVWLQGSLCWSRDLWCVSTGLVLDDYYSCTSTWGWFPILIIFANPHALAYVPVLNPHPGNELRVCKELLQKLAEERNSSTTTATPTVNPTTSPRPVAVTAATDVFLRRWVSYLVSR